MSFLNKVREVLEFVDEAAEFVGEALESYQAPKIYPTLEAALHKYLDGEGCKKIKSSPFSAKLEKPGTFSPKTVTLTVKEDGSVYIVESGFFGEETVFPKTAGAPTPKKFKQTLGEMELDVEEIEDEEDDEEMEERYWIVFTRSLFVMFGKLAETDSKASEEEKDTIKAIMTEAEFDKETRKMAIEWFKKGRKTKTPFLEVAIECAKNAKDKEMLEAALNCLVRIATADGILNAHEERYLNEAVTAFELPLETLTGALEEVLPDMEKYYEILGCDSSVSDDELKRCYREKSRKYHPDPISSKDLPPEIIGVYPGFSTPKRKYGKHLSPCCSSEYMTRP